MRKKKKNITPVYDYTKWESDFGFLILIMNRKVNIAKEYNIKPFGEQLQKPSDYIRDADIHPEYTSVVSDIYDTLSDSYKSFLISKYFHDETKLIEFISENVLDDLIKSSVETNNNKIKKQYAEEQIKTISKMNTLPKKEKK